MVHFESIVLSVPTSLNKLIYELCSKHTNDQKLQLIFNKISENWKEKGVETTSKDISSNRLTFSEILYIWENYAMDGVYLHDLLKEAEVYLPAIEEKPRDPQFEVQCQKLREEADLRKYRSMVKGISGQVGKVPEKTEESFGQEMQAVNRQLTVIFNTLITVASSAAFGFFLPSVILGFSDILLQMALALVFGLAVLLADLYFILRTERTADEKKKN